LIRSSGKDRSGIEFSTDRPRLSTHLVEVERHSPPKGRIRGLVDSFFGRDDEWTPSKDFWLLYSSSDPEDLAKVQRIYKLAKELNERYLTKYPELVPKCVKDSGLDTMMPEFLDFPFDEDVSSECRMLLENWDQVRVDEILIENTELLEQLCELAKLTEDFLCSPEYFDVVVCDTRFVRSVLVERILLLKVLDELKKQNIDIALSYTRVAISILENTEFISDYAAISFQRSVIEFIVSDVPKEKFSAKEWRDALNLELISPKDAREEYLKKFHYQIREKLFRVCYISDEWPFYISDKDLAALLDYLALDFIYKTNKFLVGESVEDWETINILEYYGLARDHLDIGSQELIASSDISPFYLKERMYLRSLYIAALESWESGSIIHDPITGTPFLWDAENKMLSHPQSYSNVLSHETIFIPFLEIE